MIYINKNVVNNIYLTLTESTTASNPYYLFQFDYDSNQTRNPIFYYTPDISISTKRYNKFVLVDSDITGTASSTQSGIGFTASLNLKAGQYTYTIYVSETPVDVYNLVGVTSSTNIIEVGRMFVNGIDTSIDIRYN